jgi:condensin complex subunit 1
MSPSFELRDEIEALQDIPNYEIPNEHEVHSGDTGPLLEGKSSLPKESYPIRKRVFLAAVEAVADSSEAITSPDVFDIYRSILKFADAVPGPVMSKLLDSISSGLLTQVDATLRDVEHEDQQTFMAHKTPLEMYAFLLQWFVTAAEKVKASGEDDAPAAAAPPKPRRGKGAKAATSRTAAAKRNETWTWSDQIPTTLALISKVLRLKTQRIWTTTAERDTFITYEVSPSKRRSFLRHRSTAASLVLPITSLKASST